MQQCTLSCKTEFVESLNMFNSSRKCLVLAFFVFFIKVEIGNLQNKYQEAWFKEKFKSQVVKITTESTAISAKNVVFYSWFQRFSYWNQSFCLSHAHVLVRSCGKVMSMHIIWVFVYSQFCKFLCGAFLLVSCDISNGSFYHRSTKWMPPCVLFSLKLETITLFCWTCIGKSYCF